MYRVLTGILAILLMNFAFALDNEYKNTLDKVELTKASEGVYSVNLYTSKELNEPVKVIKKNDLNYYILLPETKNVSIVAPVNDSEIKNVSTQMFPYANTNVKNGYTKINISTSKPLSFTVNNKAKIVDKLKNPVLPEVKKDAMVTETKAQKKNLVQEVQKVGGSSTSKETPKAVAQKEVKPVQKAEKKAAKQEIIRIELPKPEDKVAKKEPVQKEAEKPKQVAAAAKIDTEKPEVNVPPVLQTTPVEEEETEQNKEVVQNNTDVNNEVEVVREENQISFVTIFKNKLAEYGLNLKELLLMLIASILTFVIMFLILTKQKENQTRLKSKADFIDKTTNKTSTLVPKKPAKKKSENQYFVFDKNVKQTGLSAPASNRRNYELSSYSPIPEDKSQRVEPYVSKRVKSEYDILQNILKEDAFIELSNNEIVDDIVKTEVQPKVEVQPQEIVKPKEEPPVIEKIEPEVLSSVEIAPQRGFMCVNYNNTINLIGYIFDDIFALYNFKQPKLEDYTIKFRMSEKTPQGANFLVRVGRSKMLVSVSKSAMSLEVAM